MEGYNISLKIGGKTLCGRTQDDLTIAATTKESITKDDQGARKTRITGHEVSFSCSALVDITDSAAANKLNRDDIIEMALKTGDDAIVEVVYACTGGDTYKGNAVITNYSETSNAEDEATLSLELKVSGAFTKQA